VDEFLERMGDNLFLLVLHDNSQHKLLNFPRESCARDASQVKDKEYGSGYM
jgi:hypothetical protein